MKIKLIGLIALLASASIVGGIRLLPFPGWNEVKRRSPNIIIARCVKTLGDQTRTFHGLTDSEIQIVSVLKGSTNLGPAHLRSMYWPRQGELYLLFSSMMDADYDAIETYRVVPLGTYLPPDLLPGKTLDEQIQTLFQRRLDNLNRQMKEEQEEKQRLEEALKK